MNLKGSWTESEDAAVRKFAPQMSPQRLGVRLKRSSHAVADRARLLGVKFKEQRRFVPTTSEIAAWGDR